MRQIAGELVHLEDLVLRDASYDICSPTHELTRDHGVLGLRPVGPSAAGLDTLRDLPDIEQLEEAGLLNKDKLLAGELPESFGITEDDDTSDAHHTESVEPLRE